MLWIWLLPLQEKGQVGLGPMSCTHGAEGRTGTCAWDGEILDYRCSWGARGEGWLCPGAGLLAGLEQLQRLLGVWLVPLVVPVLHRVAETGEGTIAVSTLMTFLELAGERGLGSTRQHCLAPRASPCQGFMPRLPGTSAPQNNVFLYWCNGGNPQSAE